MNKSIQVIGGVDDRKWGGQWKQQYRVIDKDKSSYSICQGLQVVLTVRKWKKR